MIIIATDREGHVHRIQGKGGETLMATLRDSGLDIAAICGGACSCATCHVHVDPGWIDRLPPISADELDLLTALSAMDSRSRLSCQIMLEPALDGLPVTLAAEE